MGSEQPVVYIQRAETFSACHRLHSPRLSDEENAVLYGKCNHPNGHGHNYRVEVTLRGPVDPTTGMVINIVDLKRFMQETIMSMMDHRNLDKDVPFFKVQVSDDLEQNSKWQQPVFNSIKNWHAKFQDEGGGFAVENITVFIWDSLKEKLGELLYEIRVHETDKNVAWYKGEKSF